MSSVISSALEGMHIRVREHILTWAYMFSARSGTQVIVPYRDEDEKRHLKVCGDLGQIVPLVRVLLYFVHARD